MKTKFLPVVSALVLLAAPTFTNAQETIMKDQTATYIEMQAAMGQADAFASFLSGAAPIVKETEPRTKLWFALRNGESLAIFDVFADASARDAHFAGAVAAALNENAPELVLGGWDDGVVANISNSDVLSAKSPVDLYSATTATYIKLESAPGQGEQLAELLSAAGSIVAETEPKTLFWVALRIDDTNFAIFDIFADSSGREAHFAGQVAGLLKEKSAELVAGGWENGVVSNVHNFDILAIKQ